MTDDNEPTILHEHRAPTDESVRLLREMEAKARAEVLSSVSLQGNTIEGVVHTMYDMLSDADKFRIMYKINNRSEVLDITIHRTGDENIRHRLTKALSEDIAVKFLTDAMKNVRRH